MIDAMRDRLTDFGNDTWDLRHVLTHFLHDGCMRSAQSAGNNLDFAHVHSRRMLVQLRAARAPRRRNDLRRSMEGFFYSTTDAVGLLQRSTRRERDVDVQCAFIEGWQKFPPHKRKHHERDDQYCYGTAD